MWQDSERVLAGQAIDGRGGLDGQCFSSMIRSPRFLLDGASLHDMWATGSSFSGEVLVFMGVSASPTAIVHLRE